MNYFVHTTAAQRYVKGRPYFHPFVIEKIADRWPQKAPFARALDVACGTGMSTRALALIAGEVVGADASAQMISQAEAHPQVRYVQSPAESLPFEPNSFDLITVCMGFHWFDQPKFLEEAKRILRPGGVLVIYGHGFKGQMADQPAFGLWNQQEYLKRYPNPPRVSIDDGLGNLGRAGFRVTEEPFTHTIPLNVNQLASFLITQSNVIRHVEGGSETAEEVASWIESNAKPFFRYPTAPMVFGGQIWFCEL
jgi:SAM-dependent methyltransferase